MSTTLAYMAGFFDGEGSLGFWKSNNRGHRYFRLTMANTDMAVLDLFQVVLGGRINDKPLGKLGKKAMRQWSISGEAAWDAYYMLEPYLRLKRWSAEPVG